MEAAENDKETSEPEKPTEPDLISFDAFMKVDLRVAQILEAEKIEKSNKLVRLQVSLGPELGQR